MQYLCSLHDDSDPHPALISVMSVPTGETINVCGECQPTWALIFAGVRPELIDQALAELRALDNLPEGDTYRGSQADWQLQPAAGELPGQEGPTPALDRPLSVEDQEARIAAELAARPDSASTSGAVVDFPLPPIEGSHPGEIADSGDGG